MEKFKGTKGPWKVKPSVTKTACNVVGTQLAGKFKIARCAYVGGFEKDEQEAKANALLISKAPELLAKLQSIVNISEDKGTEGCTWGDTDMSSTDVVFGYNLALDHVKRGIEELIKQATEVSND